MIKVKVFYKQTCFFITEDVDSQNTSANNDLVLQKDGEIHQLKQHQDEFLQKHEAQIRDNAQLSR